MDDVVVGRAVCEAIRRLDALDKCDFFALCFSDEVSAKVSEWRIPFCGALHESQGLSTMKRLSARELFMLLPRCSPSNKKKVLERFSAFFRGEWDQLLKIATKQHPLPEAIRIF